MKPSLRKKAVLVLGIATVLAASATGLSWRHLRKAAELEVRSGFTSARIEVPERMQREVGTIRADLFGSTLDVQAPSRTAVLRHPVTAAVPEIRAPSDPLAPWIYRGWGEREGARYAAVENGRTGESRLLLEGETLEGLALVKLERDALTFRGPAGEHRVALSDDFSLLPGKHTGHPKQVAETSVVEDEVRDIETAIGTHVHRLYLNVDGEDMGRLRDDAFEGRISHDEFVQRSRGSSATIGYDLDDSGVFLEYRVTGTRLP